MSATTRLYNMLAEVVDDRLSILKEEREEHIAEHYCEEEECYTVRDYDEQIGHFEQLVSEATKVYVEYVAVGGEV